MESYKQQRSLRRCLHYSSRLRLPE